MLGDGNADDARRRQRSTRHSLAAWLAATSTFCLVINFRDSRR